MEMKEQVREPDFVLEIRHLRSSFFTRRGEVPAVNDVTIQVPRGKIIGIVGESGCGKSMTAKSVMGLLKYPGRVVSGEILLEGRDIAGMKERELRKICGNEITMIFQEPMTSLNPVIKVGKQVSEALLLHHRELSRAQAREQAIEMFRKVGINEPEKRYDCYPHELSGGLRQRVMIAMAMVCRPKLLIADEPTTALDVTIEAQILKLMKQLRDEIGMSIIIITHNLGVVAELCDYVYVMYAGKIMEQAETFELFDHTARPYTKGLMDSIPRIGSNAEHLHTIPGVVPNLLHLPKGCLFSNRCPYAHDRCRQERPELYQVSQQHRARCFLREKTGEEAEAHG